MILTTASDNVLIALITMIGVVISATMSAITAYIGGKNSQRIAQNTIVLHGQKETIAQLEKNTNSMKDALVKVTGESQKAIGNLEGRAELTAETNATTVNKESK
jgi:hypothetical protein